MPESGEGSVYDRLIFDDADPQPRAVYEEIVFDDSGNLQRSKSLPDLRTSDGGESLPRSQSLNDLNSSVPEPLSQSQTGRTETASKIVSFEDAVEPGAGNEVAEGKLIVRRLDQGVSNSQTSLSSDFVETTGGQLVDVSELPEGRYEVVTEVDPSFSQLDAARSAARAAEKQRLSQLSLDDLSDLGSMKNNSLSGSLESFDVDMHSRLQQIDWSDLRQNPLTDDTLDLAYTEGIRVREYDSKGVFIGTTVKGSYADGVVGTRVGDVMILPSGKEIPIDEAMLYSDAFHPLLSTSDFDDSGALALVSQGDGLYTTQTGHATVTQAFVDKFQAAGRQVEIAQGAGVLGQGDDLSDLSMVVDDVVPGASTQSGSTTPVYGVLEGPATPESVPGASAEGASTTPVYGVLEGPATPEPVSGAPAEGASTVPESNLYATLEGPTTPEPVSGAPTRRGSREQPLCDFRRRPLRSRQERRRKARPPREQHLCDFGRSDHSGACVRSGGARRVHRSREQHLCDFGRSDHSGACVRSGDARRVHRSREQHLCDFRRSDHSGARARSGDARRVHRSREQHLCDFGRSDHSGARARSGDARRVHRSREQHLCDFGRSDHSGARARSGIRSVGGRLFRVTGLCDFGSSR